MADGVHISGDMHTLRLVPLISLFVTACLGPADQLDAPLEPVIRAPPGAAVTDAGASDAGLDAGERDAGLDAGARVDGGAGVDAGVMLLDAGVDRPFFGSLLVSTTPTGLRVQASFSTSSSFPTCVETAAGTCRLRTCRGRGMSTTDSAGTLTVSVNGQSLTLSPDANGRYSGQLSTVLLPGDVVQLAASGDVVPAFSTSVAVTNFTTITAPVCALFVACDGVERATPPTLQWTPVTGLTVRATTIWEDVRGSNMALCDWPSTRGTGTIDAAVWSRIPSNEIFLLLGETNVTKTLRAGDYELNITIGPTQDFAVIE